MMSVQSTHKGLCKCDGIITKRSSNQPCQELLNRLSPDKGKRPTAQMRCGQFSGLFISISFALYNSPVGEEDSMEFTLSREKEYTFQKKASQSFIGTGGANP